MYSQNNYNGQGAGSAQPSGKQKKEKVNYVELVGYLTARSSNENDQIMFYPFKNGGGAVHCSLKVLQPTGQADEYGNPKMRTTYVPVDIAVNKMIPASTLQGLIPGMKVKVVGELKLQTYQKKNTNEKVSSLAVSAYVFEILQAPMTTMSPGYPPQPAYPPQAPGYAPQPQSPAYPPQPQTQPAPPAMGGMPGYPPQAQGYAPQPQPQPQAPGYSHQPQTQPAPPAMGRMPGYSPQAQGYPPQPQAPGYGMPPANVLAGLNNDEDLPMP